MVAMMINQNEGWGKSFVVNEWGSKFNLKENDDECEIELSVPMKWEDGSEAPEEIILAYKVGALAVHVDAKAVHYRITHLPTKAIFDKALPEKEPNKRYSFDALVKWCRKVQSELENDWKLLNSLTRETFETDNEEIVNCKDAIIVWCQSVKV